MLIEKIQSLRETIGRSYTKPDPVAYEFLVQRLWKKEEALTYLKGRGLSEETITHFKLGYSDKLDAVSIPVYKNGELVNIKYRYLNPTENKYTSEKGAEVWLYNEDGIEKAKSRGAVLVVEGEFDLMMAWQRGIKNVISPASGKDSYGMWIELLDSIPKVFIAYDNDDGGRKSAIKMSERLGVDKCFEIAYPDGVKDATDYFKAHTPEDFKDLVKKAKPFYRYQFKGLGDIIEIFRTKNAEVVTLDLIPKVEIEKDWLIMVSGKANIGKTGYILNIADKLACLGHPTLILPFERGVESVGKRFLQVKFDKTNNDFLNLQNDEWNDIIEKCVEHPIYFSLPKKSDLIETIVKAHRLFDVKFVIIDHLDYIVRQSTQTRESEIADTLQTLKRVAEENNVCIIIVTHVRKIDSAGAETQRKPNIEDLKGSSSLYQDPEVVVMLTAPNEQQIEVSVLKNKGEMTSRVFDFKHATGKFTPLIDF